MLDKKYFYINGEWVAPKKPKEIDSNYLLTCLTKANIKIEDILNVY